MRGWKLIRQGFPGGIVALQHPGRERHGCHHWSVTVVNNVVEHAGRWHSQTSRLGAFVEILPTDVLPESVCL